MKKLILSVITTACFTFAFTNLSAQERPNKDQNGNRNQSTMVQDTSKWDTSRNERMNNKKKDQRKSDKKDGHKRKDKLKSDTTERDQRTPM